jgi:hypothetical protein
MMSTKEIELEESRAREFRGYAAQATSQVYQRLWSERAESIDRRVARMRQAPEPLEQASA